MNHIRSLHLAGFQSHLNSQFELSPGVNVLVGDSDAGKSAVIRALQWLATNRPSGDAFVNAAAKDTRVTIETTTGAASRHRKPNGYTINGTTFTAIARSVPEELRAVLDLQPINVQGQLLGQYFLVLDSPGEISRYLSSLFGFELCDLLVSAIKTACQRAQIAITHAEQQLATLDSEIAARAPTDALEPLVEEAEALAALVERGAQYESALAALVTQLASARDRSVRLAAARDVDLADAERALAGLQQLETIESQIGALVSQAKQTAAARAAARTLQAETESALDEARQGYVEALGEVCGACFRPIDAETRERVRGEL